MLVEEQLDYLQIVLKASVVQWCLHLLINAVHIVKLLRLHQ